MATTIYRNNSFELASDAFKEGDLKATVSNGILTAADGETIDTRSIGDNPSITSDCPMLDALMEQDS